MGEFKFRTTNLLNSPNSTVLLGTVTTFWTTLFKPSTSLIEDDTTPYGHSLQGCLASLLGSPGLYSRAGQRNFSPVLELCYNLILVWLVLQHPPSTASSCVGVGAKYQREVLHLSSTEDRNKNTELNFTRNNYLHTESFFSSRISIALLTTSL